MIHEHSMRIAASIVGVNMKINILNKNANYSMIVVHGISQIIVNLKTLFIRIWQKCNVDIFKLQTGDLSLIGDLSFSLTSSYEISASRMDRQNSTVSTRNDVGAGDGSAQRRPRSNPPNDGPISQTRNLTASMGRVNVHNSSIPIIDLTTEEEEPVYNNPNMYLNVDNYSYEELLALGESIGNVSTGLKPEQISERMMVYRRVGKAGPQADEAPCSVCLGDCHNWTELGELDCGHEFHYECILPWLQQKNSCPLCKEVALADKREKP